MWCKNIIYKATKKITCVVSKQVLNDGGWWAAAGILYTQNLLMYLSL